MSNWTEGYVAGLDYKLAHQPELNPARLPLAFLNAGFAPPVVETACELGFGQGLSANLHSAASATTWYGTDFNAAQTRFARDMAAASGADAHFYDQSFAEFCSRTDLPDFDFIGMHGVWSWINDDNRHILVDFLRRKLKAGGVLYVSYNTQPGFAGMTPIQELLSRHAGSMGSAGVGLGGRIDAALDFAEKLVAASPLYAKAHPQIPDQLRALKSEDRSYLAHEYFNRNWVPTSFSSLADWLAPAKLEYACSSNYFNMIDAWNLRADQQALLREIPDPRFRETARDLMMNQTFRRDYWVKGGRRLTALERTEASLRARIVLIRQRGDIPLKAVGALGEFALPENLCTPILDALADHQPKTLAHIEQQVRGRGILPSQIADIALTLMRIGAVAPAQDDRVIDGARARTDRLNAYLCDKARTGTDIAILASPVTGSGFMEVGGRVALFFLHAINSGMHAAGEIAAHALHLFQAQGLTIMKHGRPVESADESLAALTAQATLFLERQLPVLRALQIAQRG